MPTDAVLSITGTNVITGNPYFQLLRNRIKTCIQHVKIFIALITALFFLPVPGYGS